MLNSWKWKTTYRLTLNDIIGLERDFMLYEGQAITDNCEKSLILVLHTPMWISPEQLNELKSSEKIIPTKPRKEGQVIYQNYGET
jgi:hypothetical protein